MRNFFIVLCAALTQRFFVLLNSTNSNLETLFHPADCMLEETTQHHKPPISSCVHAQGSFSEGSKHDLLFMMEHVITPEEVQCAYCYIVKSSTVIVIRDKQVL